MMMHQSFSKKREMDTSHASVSLKYALATNKRPRGLKCSHGPSLSSLSPCLSPAPRASSSAGERGQLTAIYALCPIYKTVLRHEVRR